MIARPLRSLADPLIDRVRSHHDDDAVFTIECAIAECDRWIMIRDRDFPAASRFAKLQGWQCRHTRSYHVKGCHPTLGRVVAEWRCRVHAA